MALTNFHCNLRSNFTRSRDEHGGCSSSTRFVAAKQFNQGQHHPGHVRGELDGGSQLYWPECLDRETALSAAAGHQPGINRPFFVHLYKWVITRLALRHGSIE
jgi:hypothetical protein